MLTKENVIETVSKLPENFSLDELVDKLIFIDMNIFHGFFGFFFLLTDYIDDLFAKRFAYARKRLNPSEA